MPTVICSQSVLKQQFDAFRSHEGKSNNARVLTRVCQLLYNVHALLGLEGFTLSVIHIAHAAFNWLRFSEVRQMQRARIG